MQPAEDLPLISVSELNRRVTGLLERQFPLVRLQAEISQVTQASSGHWYLTLKDAGASVRGVLFRREAAGLTVAPREGLQVEVRAQPSLYEPRGDFQLRLLSLKPAGQGDLYALFLRLRARLMEEGLFAESRKRPLPMSIRRVGVLTSMSGAALRDFLVTIGARAPMIQVLVFPSLVQGAEAPAALLAALERARHASLDVLAVIRGGGSLEDLWAFNDEAFLRALADCEVPVVSGVGHETDITLTDLVSDHRAATPTAAAERIAAQVTQERDHLIDVFERLRTRVQRVLDHGWQRVDRARGALRSPRHELRAQSERLASAQERLLSLQARGFVAWEARLAGAGRALAALSPLGVLSRGYLLAMDGQGAPVTSVEQMQVNATLELWAQDGRAQVQVKSLERAQGNDPESSS